MPLWIKLRLYELNVDLSIMFTVSKYYFVIQMSFKVASVIKITLRIVTG